MAPSTSYEYRVAVRGRAVSSDSSGNFVVVWQGMSRTADYGLYGVFGQRYDSLGAPQGDPFRISSESINTLKSQQIAIDHNPDGSFVTAWSGAPAGSDFDASPHPLARVFNANGSPMGAEVTVNETSLLPEGNSLYGSVDVASTGAAGFVVVWSGNTLVGYEQAAIYGQRFDTAGVKSGTAFIVNTYTSGTHVEPVVDSAGDGTFVVTENLLRLTTFVAGQSSAGWSCESNEPADKCSSTLVAVAPAEQRNVTFAVEVEAGTSPLWWVYNIVGASSTSTTIEVFAQDATPFAICDPNNFDPTTCHLGCYIAPSVCADRSTRFVIGWLAAFTRGSIGYPELHVRDNILAPTRGGQRAIDLFSEQSANAVAAAMSDASVASTALTSATTLAPLCLELADSEPSDLTITQADVDAIMAFTEALRAAAGPDLAAALDRELPRLDIPGSVGLGGDEAILKFNRLTCTGFESKLFCGEITGDCRITATDALGILRMAVGSIASVAEADVDGSGGVSATDALRVLVIAVGINQPTEACNG